jgi:prepilin-type processing-associated H-X9-DG protein
MVGERPPSASLYWGWWAWSDYDNLLATQNFIDLIGGCPMPGIFRPPNNPPYTECDVTHFWSFHLGGSNWLFGDAHVRFMPYASQPLTVPMATRSGNEAYEDEF